MTAVETSDATSEAARVGGGLDPFTFEVVKNRLASVADEMALTVTRTARSFIVKEALDFSTALFTADGELVAQGTCLPLHLGSMPSALDAVLGAFGEEMAPGDIFALNDPYDGGSHLPDIIAVKPVFEAGRKIGYAMCLAHMTDMGGRVPGSMASDSSEIYQEGLRLPPLRLYAAGRPDEAVFRILERNVRVPDKVLGDVRSQIAALGVGERGLIEMVQQFGLEDFRRYCTELLDYTERFTRSEIAKLPDGSAVFTDHIDGDGMGSGAITIRARVTVAGDAMEIDFEGTSPQVKGAINSVHSFTASATWACVRSILDRNIPNNAGYFRPIVVKTRRGSVVDPRPPAAVAARGLTADRVADTVFGALAQLAPERVPACGQTAPDIAVSFGGYDHDGRPFVFVEGIVGSWGGGPDRDGMDASTGTIVNYSNTPAEMLEAEQPLRVERYGFAADSGGAGRFRGGLAVERHIRFLAEEGALHVRTDRHDHAPYGLAGGGVGGHTALRVCRAGGDEDAFHAYLRTTVRKGDLLEVRLASGGGFGDPLAREPERVLADHLEDKVTIPHAAEAYGVAIAGTPPRVQEAETAELRSRRRRDRT
ncbi:MAG: hydantoinase B/oxoprolinase family protein [Alphaproteobacteria bacterium]|jgi:N-methylhydantoinase B|nr:hydantoinase B/oxoprolinase family protein [Alphaproteobacteria bacterium]